MSTIKTQSLSAASSNLINMIVHYDKEVTPIDFGVLISKVKVTIDIYGNKLAYTLENYRSMLIHRNWQTF